MILADASVVMWVLGLLLVGIAGFVLMAATVVIRLFDELRELLFGWLRTRVARCPREDCAHRNPAVARFCARCGRALSRDMQAGGDHG